MMASGTEALRSRTTCKADLAGLEGTKLQRCPEVLRHDAAALHVCGMTDAAGSESPLLCLGDLCNPRGLPRPCTEVYASTRAAPLAAGGQDVGSWSSARGTPHSLRMTRQFL